MSLFSKASYEPVEAPDGDIALATKFLEEISTSIVGFPLLSKTGKIFQFV